MLIFFIVYFGLVIGIRTIMLFNKTQINATKNFGKKIQTKRAERIIQFALALMLVLGLNFIFIPQNYKYFFPIGVLDLGWLKTTGFIMTMMGLMLTFIAQLQMKNSWRLGIDQNDQIELVTSGLFTISRNPIYLGLGIGFIGFFLIAPSIGSLIFLLLMFYGVSQKIDDEQQFLENKFGKKYEAYKADVNKWI